MEILPCFTCKQPDHPQLASGRPAQGQSILSGCVFSMWLVPDVISEHHCQLDEICSYPSADPGAGYSFSILDVMRVAQLASRELSRNISKNLPADYTPLTLAEVFYMATMGGARGINLSYL